MYPQSLHVHFLAPPQMPYIVASTSSHQDHRCMAGLLLREGPAPMECSYEVFCEEVDAATDAGVLIDVDGVVDEDVIDH